MAGIAEPILVTGATGQVGAVLVRRLVALGQRPVLLARPGSNRRRLADIEDRCSWQIADLRDQAQTAAAVRAVAPATVLILSTSFFNPPILTAADHEALNAGVNIAICEGLRELPGTRVLFAGSAAVYAPGGNLTESAPIEPPNVYGASKAAASLFLRAMARQYRLHDIELRLFSSYGPWERLTRLIPGTILSALEGRPVRIGSGQQQRDYVHVDDVVAAFVAAGSADLPPGTVLNISSGAPRTVLEVVRATLARLGDPVPLEVGALPTRADDVMVISGDNRRAAELLSWRPRIGFEAGLDATVAWYRSNLDLARELP